MPKNIVILFDGTSNQVSEDRTNILRLYGTLEKNAKQLVYYDPGVGTLAASESWLSIVPTGIEIFEQVTGYGLDDNVKDAYRFLVENYARGQPGRGERDAIYIFGFSRGAYTARVLAGFLHAFGLIEARNLNLLDYAYRAYKRISHASTNPDTKNASFKEIGLYERALRPDRPPIRLLGLFDTVSSVIEWGRFRPELRNRAFTQTNPSVESIRHAVAIDERRTMFMPQLWPGGREYRGNPFNKRAARPQDVREVWFAGSHGDVGGGKPDRESGLAKIALEWMIDQTKACGVLFNTRSVNTLVKGLGAKSHYAKPDPLAAAHNSMKSAWRLVEIIPRRKVEGSKRPTLFGYTLPLSERRFIPDGARIHQSVFAHAAKYGASPNLPATYTIEP
jgi:uncharacterized protein (DUF2235 family)